MGARVNSDDRNTILDKLVDYATSLGLPARAESEENGRGGAERRWVEIGFRNGRQTREVAVLPSEAAAFIGEPLDKLVFLGDYLAYLDESTGAIEARVTQASASGITRLPMVAQIPGAIPTRIGTRDGGPDVVDDAELELERGGKRLRLVSPSDFGLVLTQGPRRGKVLRIEGFAFARHDEALAALERLSGSLFFDIDVMYGLSLALQKVRTYSRRRGLAPSRKPVEFPTNVYAPEALALYQYGRSAQGLPLLEFLAYYQAVEFYFPAYAHAETSASLRTELLNPRFDPTSDNDISRLIELAAPAVRAGIGEKEQLRATLRAATTVDGVRAAIARLDGADGNPLTDKSGALQGTERLRPEATDIREQLADRIYAIRCRIVHTKQDGGNTGSDLLLPTSAEAAQLYPDIVMMRYVAQQAIFGQAKRDS